MTDTKRTTFSVADMSCNHCVAAISAALAEALPDSEFSIDLPGHLVSVEGDAAKAEAAIREAGYEPRRVS